MRKKNAVRREAQKIRIRTLRHQKQTPVYDVAKKLQISPSHTYTLMKEIADEDHVSYESMLDQPHETYNRTAPYLPHHKEEVGKELSSEDNETIRKLDELSATLRELLKTSDDILTILETLKGEN